MVSLKALVLALGALSSGVVAQVDPAQCSSLKAVASAGFPNAASLSAFCTSALSYTVPPYVASSILLHIAQLTFTQCRDNNQDHLGICDRHQVHHRH